MRSFFRVIIVVACAISCEPSVLAADEERKAAEQDSPPESPGVLSKPEVLYTSPSGAFQIEQAGQDAWVVSTGDSPQRVKLPAIQVLGESGFPDEFHFSPNDQWIFAPYHVGSCLRDSVLYHRGADKIDIFDKFNELAWQRAAKQGAFKTNFSADGMCAMTEFACWSMDSARLLIQLRGGEDKREMQDRYLYFNTRTKKFELTEYLRKLNKRNSEALPCAEPVDPLPGEAELKTKFDSLDRELNKRYSEVIAKTDKNLVENVREIERNWIKDRDEGEKFYVSLFPAAEKERRRLQFLCDVTAWRIEQPDEKWQFL